MSGNYTQVVRTVYGAQVKRAAFAPTGAGATVVAAVPGKRIAVLGLFAVSPVSSVFTFYSGDPANNKALSGPIPLSLSTPLTLQPVPHPDQAWMVTDTGEALTLNATITNVIKGVLIYSEVDA